jgi:hypothetical protein
MHKHKVSPGVSRFLQDRPGWQRSGILRAYLARLFDALSDIDRLSWFDGALDIRVWEYVHMLIREYVGRVRVLLRLSLSPILWDGANPLAFCGAPGDCRLVANSGGA